MIPKKIHYIWLGKGDKSDLMRKCISSWKKYLPDYEIIEWNEDNFDINSNQYLKEAYDNKKYAFASDYIRLYVLYHHGGIYMDTDVEVTKNLDEFLKLPAFTGFESYGNVVTGIIAAEPKNRWIKLALDSYTDDHFIKSNGCFDTTTNVVRISKITKENYGYNPEPTYQDLKDVILFPCDYFCPKDFMTGELHITDNTHAIHHFDGSWYTNVEKRQIKKRDYYLNKFGNKKGNLVYSKYLKRQRIYHFLLTPFRAVLNPVKTVEKLRRMINGRH